MATVAEALNLALDHHLSGRLEEARQLYGRILAADPDNPHALHFGGLLAAQTGRVADGVAMIRKAAARLPLAADVHGNLGKALMALGTPDGAAQAAAAFRTVLALKPDGAADWFALGGALTEAGDGPAAHRALNRALTASAATDSEPLAEAFERAGLRLYAAADWAGATDAFRKARILAPQRAEAHRMLGAALAQTGDPEGAVAALDEALRLDPTLAEAQANLVHLLVTLGRFDDAERAGRRAVVLDPGNADAYGNMVPLLEQTVRVAEALRQGARATRLAPQRAAFHRNRLSLLLHEGRRDEAVAAGREAIRLAPTDAEAHLALAVALLASGQFREGWEEFEWRWETRQLDPVHRGFAQPQWTGAEDVAGRTILLYAEQGLGDTLQFVRYAPLLAARGARVIVGCSPALVRLMAQVDGVTAAIAWGDELPAFDRHIPMMSLPRAFATDLDSIPAAVPYLHADPADVAAWRARVPADGRARVGLVWAGSPRTVRGVASPIDRRRSLPLAALAPLADVPGVRFVSLQMGPGASQLAEAPAGMDIDDPMAGVRDFADTAALAETLDLVITVDTSVCHLAGGLGRPTWTLSRADACWRWLGNREANPWYPTMRVFGQDRSGDWSGVVARLRAALTDFVEARGHVS
ncbi:tetratricopeptide (TPR) repeat protein [Azospirillum brasilense]|uniref:Tetratricopeptide (TPR) repeat protein n=1 Tax=Azospirillum brasilense TaxID=192 RepID=A0A560CJ10_AZOBR|nr:tetratricopeptide repeat protein [Azospirillum brasilense]TWA84829.1 tetratricopeptide (TPR) repeat protein [Azospirillum brasilense]